MLDVALALVPAGDDDGQAIPDLRSVRPPEEPKESEPATLDLEALVEQLRKSPELANTLAALLASAPSEK